MRSGDGRIPALDGREAAARQEATAVNAVAAALDDIGDDVVGLFRELDASLRHATVIDGVGLEPLDLRQDGRVVGFLRIELIVPQYLDA